MTIGSNGPAVVNGAANSYDRAVCFDAPVAMDTGLYAFPEKTLLQLCSDMMVRMGYGAMVGSPPAGMLDELKAYLQDAQEQLYLRYSCLRTERWWAWQLSPGRSVYDTPIDCTKALNFRKITGAYLADNGGRALQAFTASAAVADGVFVMPSIANGFEYEVTVAGTTAASEPTWPIVIGDTVVSGTATFTARTAATNRMLPIHQGINPLHYGIEGPGYPTHFELREYIEVYPAPKQPMVLWLKGHLGLKRFTEDTDTPTIDTHPLFLFALANAKAFRGQPDAGNIAQSVNRMIKELRASSHGLKRYIPRPSTAGMKLGGYYGDDCPPMAFPRGTWR